ncbi:hypothetical protein Sarmat_00354 [Rickettsiales endosymbiont of Paramecium tredecaurelia]|uniref:hypothetical protein n=1 Tax=Candidatus Sarmatiella mevalonica TaxID=2770581 RepID=UPI00192230B7|nr:hypothetical protein [Candidatus Sarmatiella mevalonica]MBL3284508.1 hypothetical protein [Candidatus Sarmatiella mevalonica]
MQSTSKVANPYATLISSMIKENKQNASQINQPQDQKNKLAGSQSSETNKASQVSEAKFTEKYPNPGIRSVESMRNAALCYYLMYAIDKSIAEGANWATSYFLAKDVDWAREHFSSLSMAIDYVLLIFERGGRLSH